MKYLKWVLLVVILGVVVMVWLNFERLDILSGYSAKSMASSVFTAERDFKFTDSTDNNFSPVDLAKDEVDFEAKSASSSVFGLNTRTAIYRDGLGAVLVPDDYDYKPNDIKPKRDFTKVALPYPFGHLEPTDTIFSNVDYEKLKTIIEKYSADGLQTRGILVLYKDHLIGEYYAEGIDKDSRMLGWSMTKSITSSVFGVLQTQGKIDINQQAPIDEWKDDERSKITINNLLQMNSGLEWVEDYNTICDVTKMLFQEEDMTVSAIDEPLVGEPNKSWYYSSGTTNLLSGILRDQFNSHQEYLDFWYTNLIDRIGMHSMVVEADMAGNYVGSSYGWASLRDWAKLGLLYLHKGNWNGDQVLNKEWIHYAITPTNSSDGRYGAQIWLNKGGFLPDVPRDVFSFNGYQGQRVYICPSKDLIVVRMGLKSIDFNGLVSDIISSIN